MEVEFVHTEDFDERMRYAFAATPYGADALVAWCRRGVCYIGFVTGSREESLADATSRMPHADMSEGDIAECPHGRLCLVGTEFRFAVWRGLLGVGPGERTTYGGLAAAIGRPRSARAVGQAVGANPVAVMVPCHRVVAADGSLHGYRWGTELKRRILERESQYPDEDFFGGLH